MCSRAGRLAAIIILFAGLLFVVDVVSPATPTPQAVQDVVSIVFGVVLLLAALMRPLFHLISPAVRFTATVLAVCADRAIDIDLLVTDIVLPLTDGHAVAHEAKALRPGLKVLFISGYTEHPVLLKNGDHDGAFLRKPFTKAALALKLREVLA